MTDSSSPDDETGQDLVPAVPPPAPSYSDPQAPIRPAAAVMARLLGFAPVPVRYRRDGWTPARQRQFVAALAGGGCVLAACRRVGQSAEAYYRLRRRPDAAGFRAACASAFRLARWARTVNFRRGWEVSGSSGSSTSAGAAGIRP